LAAALPRARTPRTGPEPWGREGSGREGSSTAPTSPPSARCRSTHAVGAPGTANPPEAEDGPGSPVDLPPVVESDLVAEVLAVSGERDGSRLAAQVDDALHGKAPLVQVGRSARFLGPRRHAASVGRS